MKLWNYCLSNKNWSQEHHTYNYKEQTRKIHVNAGNFCLITVVFQLWEVFVEWAVHWSPKPKAANPTFAFLFDATCRSLLHQFIYKWMQTCLQLNTLSQTPHCLPQYFSDAIFIFYFFKHLCKISSQLSLWWEIQRLPSHAAVWWGSAALRLTQCTAGSTHASAA